MFKNYLLIAWRNILRNKVYSAITIVGLAVGLTSAILILAFVLDEISYDQFHSKKDRIYRIHYKISDFDIARVPPVFKEHINDFFPEVESSTRLFARSVSVQVPTEGNKEARRFEESNVNFADNELLGMFDFEVIQGKLKDALLKDKSVILSRSIAEKYFGQNISVVGNTILLEGNNSYRIAAVVEDYPTQSHFHFDMILPYSQMYDLEPPGLRAIIKQNFKQNWMVSHSPTYVLLRENADAAAVNSRFTEWVETKIPENQRRGQSFEIQPLLDIHLNDEIQAQAEAPGSISFIIIFIGVGILTLLIAVINYVNLSTAKSLQRAKEIGMRKVLGAWRSDLVGQFIGESVLTTTLAAIASIGFALLLMPFFNKLTNKELSIEQFISWDICLGFIAIILTTAFLAGLYPAFFISKFPALRSIKSSISSGTDSAGLRKVLIVFQFTISIVLISGTLIVFEQLSMMRNRPLGFQKEFMIVAPIQSASFNTVFGGVDSLKRQKMNLFEERIQSIPGVLSSTVSSGAPGFGMVNRNVIPEGFTAEDNMLSPVMAVDYDFIKTYNIELIEGRDFSTSYGTDHLNAFIINEMAVANFDFGSPADAIGKEINLEGKQAKVIGVVRDFNFQSLSEAMRPIILDVSVPQFTTFSIRLRPENRETTMTQVEEEWNQVFPTETFNPNYLDESLAQRYDSQEQFGKLIGYFAFLAILISCLGSYGLIIFIAVRKQKEVGVRKVLGASILQIIGLLSGRFLYPVLIGIIIAVPVSVYLANQWLDDFSYRIDLSPSAFVIASMLTISLVFLTVSVQSYRAANNNPVNSLRDE